MNFKRDTKTGEIVNPKSTVSNLTREIDGLVREYVQSGEQSSVEKASKLSRQREYLLKPVIARRGKVKVAG